MLKCNKENVRLVKEAEASVRRMMEVAGVSPLGPFSDSDCDRAFGLSKKELEHREKYLQQLYRKTPRRYRSERAALRRSYAEVHAMLGLPYGLTTIWI